MNREVHDAKLVSITPDAEEQIVYMARVSNPSNQNNMETAPRLIKYLIKHKHWSPFEMASMQVEINTTRAIAAQVLRHRSFSFQDRSSLSATVLLATCLRLACHICGHKTSKTNRLAMMTLIQKWSSS